jgi:hypothetical protein
MNEPIGRRGSDKPARLRRIAFENARHGVVLPHNALLQPLFHVHKFPRFALEQPPDRNSGPLGHDFRNVFFADFFAQNRAVLLHFRQMRLSLGQLLFRRVQLAVTNLRDFRQIARAFQALLVGL